MAAFFAYHHQKEKASSKEVKAERLGRLVRLVMGNGAPDVFQTFVRILLNEPHVKWLGDELNGIRRSRIAITAPAPRSSVIEVLYTARKRWLF